LTGKPGLLIPSFRPVDIGKGCARFRDRRPRPPRLRPLRGATVLLQQRFRKTDNGSFAELWVDVGLLRYDVELYENGCFARRQRGWRKGREIEAHLVGSDFAALVRIDSSGHIACTWAR
jgi:hypothetical protein